MPTRIQTQAVSDFKCLGGECPDTCCQGWAMQVTPETIAKIDREAPQLRDAVVQTDTGFIMKRDTITDQCLKLDNGWCSIHRDYGEDFLGDACRFFPRITRAIGTTVMTSAALSCPETARLMLYTPDAFMLTPRQEIHAPYSLKNYLPAEVGEEDALFIHQSFLDAAGDTTFTPERNLMRLSAATRAIAMQPLSAWKDAVPLYLMMAEGRIPAAEPLANDIFNLLHALQGLVIATNAPRPRLLGLVDTLAGALGMAFDHMNHAVNLAPDASQRALALLHHMRLQAPALAPVLYRYLQAQLSQAFFPFAGFGASLADRITIIGVRFATVKLALATLEVAPDPAKVVATIQTLSRFCDHLADPTLSITIYNETGWSREARLRALVGD